MGLKPYLIGLDTLVLVVFIFGFIQVDTVASTGGGSGYRLPLFVRVSGVMACSENGKMLIVSLQHSSSLFFAEALCNEAMGYHQKRQQFGLANWTLCFKS